MFRTARAFLVVATAFAGGLGAGAGAISAARADGVSRYAGLDSFARALTTIETHFIEERSTGALVASAISGMTDDLDEHSFYLDPDAWQALQTRTEGRFYGVGVELVPAGQGVRVRRVFTKGPADLAGIQAGDLLRTVDGQAVRDLDHAGELLTGERGTPVRLGLSRGADIVDAAVVRDQVIEPAVEVELIEAGWGLVRMSHFRHHAAADLEAGLSELKAQSGGRLQGAIIDLRGNPGGVLEEAVESVDLFVSDGVIVRTRDRSGALLEEHKATRKTPFADLDLVLLIDGGSASAAEILAGALQDLGRASVAGSDSYGKGSVQNVYEFDDGSALKLTVARYHLPSGRPILQGKGVTPDVPIDDGEADPLAALRTAMDELPPETSARLRQHLDALECQPADDHGVPWVGTATERMEHDLALAGAWKALQAL